MALKNTISSMHELLSVLKKDLEKAEGGNKAASQRVRTGSIKFEKIAKLFRKESVKAEKSGGVKKKSAAKKTAKKKPVAKKAPAKKAKATKKKRR